MNFSLNDTKLISELEKQIERTEKDLKLYKNTKYKQVVRNRLNDLQILYENLTGGKYAGKDNQSD